jgi:hypothetical protein
MLMYIRYVHIFVWRVLCFTYKKVSRRKIRLIESNAKCRYLKKFTCKGTLRQVFCLSEAPSILTHTWKGGGGRANQREV